MYSTLFALVRYLTYGCAKMDASILVGYLTYLTHMLKRKNVPLVSGIQYSTTAFQKF